MSVYPKHIIKGDNVIIHIRVSNHSIFCLPVKVSLYIKHAKKDYIKSIIKDKQFIVSPKDNNKGGELERYYTFKTNNKSILGKYNFILSIKYLDKKSVSLTKNNAYFYIEKIKIEKKNDLLIINNKSDFKTRIEVHYFNKKYLKNIMPLSSIRMPLDNFLYIEYANNEILL